jgi:hypothetical protein
MIQEERVKESCYLQMILFCTHSLSMDKILRSLPISRIDTGSNLHIQTCPSSMLMTFQSMGADGILLNLPIKRSLKRKITTKVSIVDASAATTPNSISISFKISFFLFVEIVTNILKYHDAIAGGK